MRRWQWPFLGLAAGAPWGALVLVALYLLDGEGSIAGGLAFSVVLGTPLGAGIGLGAGIVLALVGPSSPRWAAAVGAVAPQPALFLWFADTGNRSALMVASAAAWFAVAASRAVRPRPLTSQ